MVVLDINDFFVTLNKQNELMFVTFNRFVRFVSTPEILERVYTLESEILQIEEAIAIQGNNDLGQSIVSLCIDTHSLAYLIGNRVLIDVLLLDRLKSINLNLWEVVKVWHQYN